MDPEVTLEWLISALHAGRWTEVNEHSQSLAEWTERGGFIPKELPRLFHALCFTAQMVEEEEE